MSRKSVALAVFLFSLSDFCFTFDMDEFRKWDFEVIFGRELDIDWELKEEDWGQQFCNIPPSRNHRHFLEPSQIGSWYGAIPAFVDWDYERVMVIRCVNNRKASYIHVAWNPSTGKALAVWRQDEQLY